MSECLHVHLVEHALRVQPGHGESFTTPAYVCPTCLGILTFYDPYTTMKSTGLSVVGVLPTPGQAGFLLGDVHLPETFNLKAIT